MKQFEFVFVYGRSTPTAKVVEFHNKEQWDLDVFPLLCVHVSDSNSCTRQFCIDRKGIQVGRKRLDFGTWKVY